MKSAGVAVTKVAVQPPAPDQDEFVPYKKTTN
jgi:hypothetical protein